MNVATTATIHQRRWWTLAVLCLSLLVIGLDNTILNVALPTLVKDLGATASQQQWMVDTYVLVFASLPLTAGMLADRFAPRRLQVGLVVFGLGFDRGGVRRLGRHAHRRASGRGRRRAAIMPADAVDPDHRVHREGEWACAIGAWSAWPGWGSPSDP